MIGACGHGQVSWQLHRQSLQRLISSKLAARVPAGLGPSNAAYRERQDLLLRLFYYQGYTMQKLGPKSSSGLRLALLWAFQPACP
jgi:hypothetical protein